MAKKRISNDKPKNKTRDKNKDNSTSSLSKAYNKRGNKDTVSIATQKPHVDQSELFHGENIKNSDAKKTTQHVNAVNGRYSTSDKISIIESLSKIELRKIEGERPDEVAPLILETIADENYGLLDSGNGLKLERYGPYKIIRPEGQALWQPSLDIKYWNDADAIFTGNTDEEGLGRWNFPKMPLGETWPMAWCGLPFLGRFTSFRHVGVFPEQDAHWRFMEKQIIDAKRPVNVLNLFGYTGVASLIAARAGAQVTHVDASKKAIGWARENQEMAGLMDKPIRWICEDAMKFVEREARRGKTYDIILLDPPAYGRGPHGEVWQLFDHLPQMVAGCRDILSNKPLAVVLTAYSIRASFYAIHELMRDRFRGLNGQVQSGELILREKQAKRALSTSLFSRWIA